MRPPRTPPRSYPPPLPPPGLAPGRPPAARPSSRRGHSGTGGLPHPAAAGARASGGGGGGEAQCQSRALNSLVTLESSPSPCDGDPGSRDSRPGRPRPPWMVSPSNSVRCLRAPRGALRLQDTELRGSSRLLLPCVSGPKPPAALLPPCRPTYRWTAPPASRTGVSLAGRQAAP